VRALDSGEIGSDARLRLTMFQQTERTSGLKLFFGRGRSGTPDHLGARSSQFA